LLIAYTAARPGSILEASKLKTLEDADIGDDPAFLLSVKDSDALPDCLKYKDVQLFKIGDESGSGASILVMVITLRLMKGMRNKGAP
jgi:hypothetical protein